MKILTLFLLTALMVERFQFSLKPTTRFLDDEEEEDEDEGNPEDYEDTVTDLQD